jgi:MYXO-CTERM domain-containing protein
MAAIIGHLLPLAVGVALSSVPIIVMVLILLSPRGRWSGLAYLVGAVLGLAGVTTAFTAAASLLPPPAPEQPNPLFATIELVLGFALLALAAVRLVRRRRRLRQQRQQGRRVDVTRTGADSTLDTHSETETAIDGDTAPPTPAWMLRLTSAGPAASLGVGVLLMLRPKNLLLTLAAGVAIAAGGEPPQLAAVAIGVFVLLGASTLIAPILFAVFDPTRTAGPLERTRVWIARNSATVTTVVLLVLGTVIIGSGLARY